MVIVRYRTNVNANLAGPGKIARNVSCYRDVSMVIVIIPWNVFVMSITKGFFARHVRFRKVIGRLFEFENNGNIDFSRQCLDCQTDNRCCLTTNF